MKRVMVGLSGGVDSAVAAYLLKKKGYDVVGAFMKNWDSLANSDILGNPTSFDEKCPQEVDYKDAKEIANKLEIKLYRVDFTREYWDKVFTYFIDEYKRGRTPNPDILCNKHIKFDSFLKFAKTKGVDYIATGHYARVIDDDPGSMYKAKDLNKDQTYFLAALNENQIQSCLFPLGDINKEKVREIAKSLDLKVANKKDSTGICFIGERNFRQFLNNYIPMKKGNIIDKKTNNKIGEHNGVFFYTIGQRKGLGIGGIKGLKPKKWFVVEKDIKKNILYVSNEDDRDYIYANRCIVKNLNWLGSRLEKNKAKKMKAKFRYRQKDIDVEVKLIEKDTLEVVTSSLIRAITSGQFAVFYKDNKCLGGGVIDEVYNNDRKLLI